MRFFNQISYRIFIFVLHKRKNMKPNSLRILPYLFLILLGNACHTSGPMNKELRLADSIMEENPDTAMYVLSHIANPEVMSAEEYAMYCLLSTQAADLTNTPHTSDELISIAVNYFKDSDNLPAKAKAHYYMARVKEDLFQITEAEEQYLLAVAAMEKTKNYKYTGEMYTRISKFFQAHGRYTESYEMQQKAYNNYLLAVKNESKPHFLLFVIPVIVICVLLFFLIRYQLNLNKEKRVLAKQEKQLNLARVTIETQRTELTHLKKEVNTLKKSFYNSSDIVQKVRLFNNIGITSKEKPVLTEHEWSMYLNTLNDTFGFVSKLRQSYHKLTDIDIRICALLREGISTLHIGSLMNMTPETLNRRIQRIKSEKMNQGKAMHSLDVILRGI